MDNKAMKPTGLYKITDEYISLIAKLSGIYQDRKERPIYCCVQDKKDPMVFWAIPTSSLSNRSEENILAHRYFATDPRCSLFVSPQITPIGKLRDKGIGVQFSKHVVFDCLDSPTTKASIVDPMNTKKR